MSRFQADTRNVCRGVFQVCCQAGVHIPSPLPLLFVGITSRQLQNRARCDDSLWFCGHDRGCNNLFFCLCSPVGAGQRCSPAVQQAGLSHRAAGGRVGTHPQRHQPATGTAGACGVLCQLSRRQLRVFGAKQMWPAQLQRFPDSPSSSQLSSSESPLLCPAYRHRVGLLRWAQMLR